MARKMLTLALALSLVLGIMALPVAADPEGTNLIQNGDFEELHPSDEAKLAGWNGDYTVQEANADVSAHSGSRFMMVSGDAYCTVFPVEPNKTYMLTIWALTSKAKAGYIDLRFRKNGNTFNKTISGQYVSGQHIMTEYFGTAKAEPAEGEPDPRLVWEKHEFSFTAHELADEASLTISNKQSDPYFCIDDVSLVEIDREPNLIRNGYMDAFKNGGAALSGNTGNQSFAGVTYEQDDDGNTIFKTTKGNSSYFPLFGALYSGRYKLSFDYRNDGSAANVPGIYMKDTDGLIKAAWYSTQNTHWKEVWQRYEVYFTIPAVDGAPGVNVSDFRLRGGTDTTYFKNIRLWYDESNVEYSSRFTDGKSQLQFAASEKQQRASEWYCPITKISDVAASDGVHTLYTKAHYIPKGTGEEAFVHIDALYKVYENGRMLDRVYLTDGTASGGQVGGTNKEITVPQLTGEEGYTYEIHSFVFSNMTDIEPMTEKTVLTY